MAVPDRIVIVGAGLAGASAAAGLRDEGYTGHVALFGRQPHRPYELPALSKGILLGAAEEPDWVRDADFYAAHDIALHPSTVVTAVRPADHVVVDAAGTEHAYDRLVLATGSTPRALPVPGGDLPGLFTLRTLDDSLALRAALTEGARVVVLGGGWIGCEVAAAARSHGAEVTVVEKLALPLVTVLGDTVATVFRDLHTEHGVHWRLGIGVDAISAAGDGFTVRLDDGGELPADVVVVAVGAKPETGLAADAGIDLAEAGGVAVDAALRTSAPDVFAIGDIAAHPHPRYGQVVRVEHWANAKDQGKHVVGNVLGGDAPYDASPYFFSDQYDLGMEYRGLADPVKDELTVRGDLATREFVATWSREGRVRAAMNVNIWDEGDDLQAQVDAYK
jgi:3-phenylpropionate/trans-cinnamate dioxygenase ferredoxin reductase component